MPQVATWEAGVGVVGAVLEGLPGWDARRWTSPSAVQGRGGAQCPGEGSEAAQECGSETTQECGSGRGRVRRRAIRRAVEVAQALELVTCLARQPGVGRP
jgi:hypothetical protein